MQAPSVFAQPAPEAADEAALRMLSVRERVVLAPHLERGVVLLAPYRRQGEMPSILLAARVHASADQVAEVIARPQAYPSFMPALDGVEVEAQEGTQTAYRWSWSVSLFTLSGRNVMTVFPGHPRRGHRIDVRATGGDLGVGRLRWRVIPEGPERSLVVLSQRIDMRDANYVASQLSAGGTSVQRSINITLGTVMLLGTSEEAERRAGHPRTSAPIGNLERPAMDYAALAPLLGVGDLVFLEREGATIGRVGVLGRSGTGRERARAVMADPAQFGRTLIDGSHAEVVERREDGVVFSWGIPLPLVGVSGRMLLRASEQVITVDGESGSMASGRWRFDTHVYPWGEAAIVGWARFDPREASGLVRRLIGDDHHFAHGLAMATQVMIVRSVRRQAMRPR